MSGHISIKPRMLIISDTNMWISEGDVMVFEPTLREVEQLCSIFEEIVWIGFGAPGNPPAIARFTYLKSITFVRLPYARGGDTILQKLRILKFLPRMVRQIGASIRSFDVIHTRGPSVPALITIFFSFFQRDKIHWHKYAGNWAEINPPFSYGLQRFLLKRLPQHSVTVNGAWQKQKKRILSFENPCFTNEELCVAVSKAKMKHFSEKLTLLFVGRIEHEKGVGRIIDTLTAMEHLEDNVKEIVFAGWGKNYEEMTEKAKLLKIPFTFTGFLSRSALDALYAQAHILLLPTTASEGFPKVIAEAGAFGCVPVVSSVSSLGQYITSGKNGLVCDDLSAPFMIRALNRLFENRDVLRNLSSNICKTAALFTYSRYNERIQNEILNRRDIST